MNDTGVGNTQSFDLRRGSVSFSVSPCILSAAGVVASGLVGTSAPCHLIKCSIVRTTAVIAAANRVLLSVLTNRVCFIASVNSVTNAGSPT